MLRTVRCLLVAALIAAIASSAPSATALAPDDEDVVDLAEDAFVNVADDLGPGTCTPDEVAIEQALTCRFELVGPASRLDVFSLHAAVLGNEQAASSRCTVDDRTLVCADLLAPFEEGPFEVTVVPIGQGRALASATVNRSVDGVLGLTVIARRIPLVFAGVETTLGTFRSFALADDEEAELLLRRHGEDEIVARVPALPADAGEGVAVLTFPEPGRWTVAGCVTEADGTCRVEGIRRPIHAIDPDPIPLLPDHNGPSEDRIDLVFVGSGFGGNDDLAGTVIELLGVDGEPNPQDAGAGVYGLDWGPFSIEPLHQKLDRFNLWYLGDDLPSGSIVIDPLVERPNPQIRIEDLGLGTSVSVVTVSRNGIADGSRANAELASFADLLALPDRSEVRFGSAYLPVDGDAPAVAATLAHELGHALFGLRDEYEEFTEFGPLEPLLGLPNCAGSVSEAEDLWGPLVGELDPMFDRWRDAMVENDLWFESPEAAEDFTVDFVTGGCFGPFDGDGAVRPTARSLMNGEEPVFGAVNRQRVQAVLDLFPEPPPPPSTTTTVAPSPAPTEEASPTTGEAELASAPADDGSPTNRSLPLIGAVVGAAAAAAAVAVGRNRRRRLQH